MNELVTATHQQQHRIFAAIDARNLAKSTKAQYKREVVKATSPVCTCGHKAYEHEQGEGCNHASCSCEAFSYAAPGVNLLDAQQVKAYASELPTSSRSFLRAAVRTMANAAKLEVKNQATPENVAQVHATIYRLDALEDAVEREPQGKGQKLHNWLSASDVRRLKACITGRMARRDKIVIGLLVGAGLRRDEVVNLRWRDIERTPARVVLNIVGKGDKARAVPISDSLARELEDWRKFCGELEDSEAHVVRGLAAGGVLTDSLTGAQVYNICRKYGKCIGKPKLAPHDLRRTFARLAWEAGVPIPQIQLLLGHADIKTTMNYIGVELDLEVTASDFIPW